MGNRNIGIYRLLLRIPIDAVYFIICGYAGRTECGEETGADEKSDPEIGRAVLFYFLNSRSSFISFIEGLPRIRDNLLAKDRRLVHNGCNGFIYRVINGRLAVYKAIDKMGKKSIAFVKSKDFYRRSFPFWGLKADNVLA